ncbi:MAG: NAD(P)/FAD-dependent oxidoreductase [Chloroflexota bacterium]|nr:NAD(P)/FAD-dependent oxidoreductase [Chloroflexota bacterium]
MARHHEADVIIVGGGPAGLSAAIYLARYGRSVALFDLGHGRSTHRQTNHNFLGFPGGIKTTDLRQRGLEQLSEYDHVRVEHHKVDKLERTDDGFVAGGQFGTTAGKAVILATGVVDHFPHFHGWEPYVGTSMFWCITCDGYESRSKKIVVAGHTNASAGEAMQMTRLSDDITLVTNSHVDEIDDTFQRRLAAAGIPVIPGRISRVVGEDGQIHTLELESGQEVPVERFFVVQGATPETELAKKLDVQLAENGYILIDTEQKTSVPGVFAAGDITQLHSAQVSAAVHEGAQAASAANYYLYPAELKGE